MQIGSAITNSSVTVSNGQFTTALDFGKGVFTGQARWIEIGVRSNGVSAANFAIGEQHLQPDSPCVNAGSAALAPTNWLELMLSHSG